MSQKKLERLSELLLDTGKRNPLMNARDSRAAGGEIVLPDAEAFFAKATAAATFEILDPAFGEEAEEDPALFEPVYGADQSVTGKRLSRGEYIAAFGEKRKRRNQILLYNPYTDPITVMKNLHRRARAAIEETGVNVAYLTFGFVHWQEKGEKDVFRAPLLLIPVTVRHESPMEPYFLVTSEDDVLVNPTFRYKLQSEFGLTLPEYGEESLSEYLSLVAETVTCLGYTVSSACHLGLFSFLKLHMYRDLKDNAETILQNDNVRRLLGESVPPDTGRQYTARELERVVHNVVDADSSQMEAIGMAKSGRSFVLQGPPGTGKSQTITNIIAESLMDGKRVLFVSEKLAALRVVYEKLKGAELADFCLELHSHKANKKDVIAALCQALKSPRYEVSSRAEAVLAEGERAEALLDQHAEALHRVSDSELYSLYQLIGLYCDSRENELEVPLPGATEGDISLLDRDTSLLDRYRDIAPALGGDYRQSPWLGFRGQGIESSYRTRFVLRDVITFLDTWSAKATLIEERFGVTVNTLQAYRFYLSLFELLGSTALLTPALLTPEAVKEAEEALARLQSKAAELAEAREKLTPLYDKDVFSLDGRTMLRQLTVEFDQPLSRLFSKEYKALLLSLRYCRRDGKKLKYEEAVMAATALSRYKDRAEAFAAEEAAVGHRLGPAYKGEASDFEALRAELLLLRDKLAAGYDVGSTLSVTKEDFYGNQKDFTTAAAFMRDTLAHGQKALGELYEGFDQTVLDLTATPFPTLRARLEACLEKVEALRYWGTLLSLTEEMERAQLLPFLHHALDLKIPLERLSAVYEKTYLSQRISHALSADPSLAAFSRTTQDRAVEAFSEKDHLRFAIGKAKIKAVLSALRPAPDAVVAGSAVSLLLREGEKKRRQKSIRTLLSEIGPLAQTLKPCFLMSPLSVSTFLAASEITFDLVIFDEASQIFPQDAIGAIYRAKQLIVVGDSQQMPPSDFFRATTEIAEEGEEEDPTNFESVLDVASTVLPSLELKWHYRSRYEPLIVFSNHAFYGDSLITFPSATGDKPWIGVDFHPVEGTFDRRTRTNRREAEYVVELIYENLRRFPDRSLGVVAFSIAQQSLIERLLLRRRLETPGMEGFFRSDRPEPFFVKNLETVQGDERDTILFSVGYAKGTDGKLLHNFGPLNRAGGERRLNVAVTRARMSVQLVTSLRHTDIDPRRTSAMGAILLRDYLAYAERGSLGADRREDARRDGAPPYAFCFEESVCRFLREKGYTVDMRIGSSDYRVDMGVRLPDSEDYALAVECDGLTYHGAVNTRDRDRLRREVLCRMGWHHHRVWAVEWFRDPAAEQARLLAAVEKAIREAPDTEATPAETVDFDVEAKAEVLFPTYQTVDLVPLLRKHGDDMAALLRELLPAEAPLSEEWLLKRLAAATDQPKAVLDAAFATAVSKLQSDGYVRREGFLYRTEDGAIPFRVAKVAGEEAPREIRYISIEELASGMRILLRENGRLSVADLFHAMATLLGFARVGSAIRLRLEQALIALQDELDYNEDGISLKA